MPEAHFFRGEYTSDLSGLETPAGKLTVHLPSGLLVITPQPVGRASVVLEVRREASESVVRVIMSFAAKGDRPFRFEELPNDFREFSIVLDRELHQLASELVSFVRWRFALAGGHRSIASFGGIFWRAADRTWSRVPTSLSVVVRPERTVILSDGTAEAAMSRFLGKEPIGHELWREAWAIQESAPRSALLIGVASLEVGVKEWIAGQIRETRWLMSEVPSPPVVRMLNEYAPKLAVLKGHSARAKRLPKDLVTTLNKGVRLRNEIVHAGATVFSENDLREFLYTVRDALYLLDSFSAHDWALGHVRRTTVDRLRPPPTDGDDE